jgi:hypothetical protein
VVIWGAAVVGWVVLPPVALRGLIQLAGWNGRWVPWVVSPVLLVVVGGALALVTKSSGPGERYSSHVEYLLGALGVALAGALLLPGPRLWRRLIGLGPRADSPPA